MRHALIGAPGSVASPSNLSFREWLGGQGLSATTRAARLKFAAEREREWGRWDLTGEEVAAYLDRFTGWTKRTYYSHLVSVYAWQVETGKLDVSPMVRIPRPPAPRMRARPLSEIELRRALDAATGDVRAHLLLGYLQGLRASEVAAIHGRDVQETGLYVIGKGGQGDMLPTHPAIWELAQAYPRDGYWFPSEHEHLEHITGQTVTKRIRALFARLGIEGAHHRARHTYGTQLARSGVPIRVVQELLRHRWLNTTQIYTGVDEDEKRAALRGLTA